MKLKTIKTNIKKIINQDELIEESKEYINFTRKLIFLRFFDNIVRYNPTYNTSKKIQLLKKLFYMFYYNTEIKNISNINDNYLKMMNLNPKDSSSIEYYTTIYGKEMGIKKQKNKSNKTAITVDNFIKKVGIRYKDINEAKEAFRNSRNGTSDKKFKEKYGDDWKFHKSNYLEKKMYKQSIEFLGESEFKKRKKHYKYSNSKQGYIEKYGYEKGTLKWYNKNKKISDSVSKLDHNRDNVSLKSFKLRLGNKQGQIEYDNLCEKHRKIAIKNNSYLHFGKNNGCVSKISTKFYNDIKKIFEVEREFKINRYYYDFKIGNTIIEFNGDYWHCNPEKYSPDDIVKFPNRTISAKDKWKEDNIKLNLAKNNGFRTIIVWENDYRNNKEETILKITKLIKNE